jgi:CDP-glycerol glycerophosphotransferase (TagB/SpsB family)
LRVPEDAEAARASRLSLIVPVHNVRAYLRACLDSIFDQGFADLEVVAVDDASPDGSGQILDEYAERHPELRVLHLEANVGLGPARNAGLDVATGEYLLFLDSDDLLAPGALRAIEDRLATLDDPDVLVFDYAKTFWTGPTRRNRLAGLLEEAGPQVFSIDARPKLLTLLMIVWNKAYRRDFVTAGGFRFPPGYYEDLPWTYPVLLSAERIGVLDAACVHYRQRRAGNILGSRNDKHFDAFDQYQRVFDWLDAHPRAERWRPFLYGRMLRHYNTILIQPDRLPAARRADFFHRAAAHARRFRPAGQARHPLALPDRGSLLIERGNYAAYRALRVAQAERSRGRRIVSTARSRWRKPIRNARHRARVAYYRAQRQRPLDRNLAVYAAYWYRGYGDNPAAIYEKARELAPQVRGVWIVEPSHAAGMPEGVDYIIAGSRDYWDVLSRAGYLISNVGFPAAVIKRPGSVWVQTHHGTPLKSMGLDELRFPLAARRAGPVASMRRVDRLDYVLSSNRYSTEVWERAYPSDYEILESGYPRNDRLVNAGPDEIATIRDRLGIGASQTAVLYAPTFRDYQRGFQPVGDLGALADALGPDTVLLARNHYFDASNGGGSGDLRRAGRVIDVSAQRCVEELYLAADVLVTDYSSAMFDYALLDRPIVIYAPDWELYRATRGTYFDLLAEPPGVVTRTEAELVEALRSGAYGAEPATKLRAAFREKFCTFDDGHAAERVVQRIFGDRPETSMPRRC